jgi:hypothetical protein
VATAKLNGVEPLAWLTDVLERMVSGRTKIHELERLLPRAWKAERVASAVDAGTQRRPENACSGTEANKSAIVRSGEVSRAYRPLPSDA